MKRYANAKEILPKKLLEELQAHFTGLLYVPGEKSYDSYKSQIIIKLAKEGASTKEIADIVGLSPRRINQIIGGRRKRKVEWIWNE